MGMKEIPICYYVNVWQLWTSQLAIFDVSFGGSMVL